jgi:hypothetical protein
MSHASPAQKSFDYLHLPLQLAISGANAIIDPDDGVGFKYDVEFEAQPSRANASTLNPLPSGCRRAKVDPPGADGLSPPYNASTRWPTQQLPIRAGGCVTSFSNPTAIGAIRCRSRLGGLLREYSRAPNVAAA